MVGEGSRPSVASILVGVLCLGLALWGLIRPALGVRFVAAAMGARLVLTALPGETAGWQWPVLALVLFGVGRLVSPRAQLRRAKKRQPRDAALGAATVALGCVAAVTLFTPALRPSPWGSESRLAALRALAPRGGYLWPALSETVAWEDNTGYRAWDNLDVRYLNDSGDRGLFRLPGSSPLRGRFSLNPDVERMRSLKDAAELGDLHAAAHAIVSAVRETAPGRTPGLTERAIAESIQRFGRAAGCTEDSFPPVVASGERAASIHAAPTEAALRVGDMVMVDVGCSVHHYASDFTRTFPVGGHFTAEQRRDYGAVYAAQQAALAACRPGAVLSARVPRRNPPWTPLPTASSRSVSARGRTATHSGTGWASSSMTSGRMDRCKREWCSPSSRASTCRGSSASASRTPTASPRRAASCSPPDCRQSRTRWRPSSQRRQHKAHRSPTPPLPSPR